MVTKTNKAVGQLIKQLLRELLFILFLQALIHLWYVAIVLVALVFIFISQLHSTVIRYRLGRFCDGVFEWTRCLHLKNPRLQH